MSTTTIATEFATKAKLHWTKAREDKITGGKDWLVRPSQDASLLRVLGLLNSDASMAADAVRKFSQINHMLTLLRPALEDLVSRHSVVRIVDAGCGTSHLTLLLAWLLRERWSKTALIVGIDSNPKVIATSAQRAASLGLEASVKFHLAKIGEVSWGALYSELFPEQENGRPHLVVSLHACDTATDQAMAFAVQEKADVMAFAPCCHAELARKWKTSGEAADDHPFAPVFRTPNLRRETAAQITDTMRMLLLRSHGYEVTATEFVPSAHTPKNRLLLCERRGQFLKSAAAEFQSLKGALAGQGIMLESLLQS